jgi:hypothetical protein
MHVAAYVSSVLGVSSRCCICLQWFSNIFSGVFFASVQTHVSSVSSVFFCMLQLLHLNFLKVDWVLDMGCMWEESGGVDDI